MGVFIQIATRSEEISAPTARELVQLCPVDIFTIQENGYLAARTEQEDECTLCELCLDAAPSDAITIRKMYKDEELVSRGQTHVADAVIQDDE